MPLSAHLHGPGRQTAGVRGGDRIAVELQAPETHGQSTTINKQALLAIRRPMLYRLQSGDTLVLSPARHPEPTNKHQQTRMAACTSGVVIELP